nr:probable sulfate transporter 3.4 [Tanacetum cinerariifolium]
MCTNHNNGGAGDGYGYENFVAGISYAKLANFPPIIGLYSSFVPPLIYSVLGSLRHLVVRPVSIALLVMGTMLNEAVPYAQDHVLYLKKVLDKLKDTNVHEFKRVNVMILLILQDGYVEEFISAYWLKSNFHSFMDEVSVAEMKKLKKPKLTTISSCSNKDKAYWLIFNFYSFVDNVPAVEMKKLKKSKLTTISSCSNKDKEEPTIYTGSYVVYKVMDGAIIDIGSAVNKKLDLP